MNDRREAARQVVDRAAGGRPDQHGALLVVAAAVLAERRAPTPEIRFLQQAALPDGQQIFDYAAQIDPEVRFMLWEIAEPLLARIDPISAWKIVCAVLGEPDCLVRPTIGLDVAAHLGEAEARRLFEAKLKNNPLFACEFEGEARARARLIPAAESEFSAAELGGAAVSNPKQALNLVDSLLDRVAPWEALEALRILSECLVASGLGGHVAARVEQPNFVSVQAVWLDAASASAALSSAEICTHADRLIPRVADELDPDRQWVGGLPIASSLVRANEFRRAVDLCNLWRLSPATLIEEMFKNGSCSCNPKFLSSLAASDWQSEDREPWWLDPHDPEGSCIDAIIVASNSLWSPLPGSLRDRIRLETSKAFA